MKIVLLSIFALLGFSLLFASEFRVSTKVDSVSKNGYYKIIIPSEIISYSKEDYSDIRLVDSKNEEVPYIFREELPAAQTTGFNEYPILENKYLADKKQTRLIIHNSARKVISNLDFIIRNTDIEKEFILNGSDNKQDWFIIQKGKPGRMGTFNETAGVYTFNFPKSDYEFLEVTLNDKQKDPVQILKVGYFTNETSTGLYAEIPVLSFEQKDSSDKQTYVKIIFKNETELSRLELKLSGPEYYQRFVSVITYRNYNNKRVPESLGSFELSSNRPPIWDTEKIRVKELVLVIANSDNKPLQIEEIKAFQLQKYLLAKLEAGKSYFVKSGNANLYNPDYDIKYFSQSIPDSLTVLKTGLISISKDKDTQSPQFFTKTIMWTVVILVIGLLGFLSIKMVREMGRKE